MGDSEKRQCKIYLNEMNIILFDPDELRGLLIIDRRPHPPLYYGI